MDDKALLDQVVMLYWSVDSSSSLKYVPKENNKTMRELSHIYIHTLLLQKSSIRVDRPWYHKAVLPTKPITAGMLLKTVKDGECLFIMLF